MTNAFQVAAHRDACAEDETGLPYLVVFFESGRPGILGHLRALRVEEGGVQLLRIAWAQVTYGDEEAALLETLPELEPESLERFFADLSELLERGDR